MIMKAGGNLLSHKIVLITYLTAEKVAECIEKYNRFVSRVVELGLVSIGDAKTVLTARICFIL